MKFFIFILTFFIFSTTDANAFYFDWKNMLDFHNPFDESYVRPLDYNLDDIREVDDFTHAKIIYQQKEEDKDFGEEKAEKVEVKGNTVTVCNVKQVSSAKEIAIQTMVAHVNKTKISSSSRVECHDTENSEGCIYEIETTSKSIAKADSIETQTLNNDCFLFTFNNISSKGTVIKNIDHLSAFDKTDTYDNTSYVTINVVNTNYAVDAFINGKYYVVNTGYPLKFKGPLKLNVVVDHPSFQSKHFEINIPEKPQYITRNVSLIPVDRSKEKAVKKQGDWAFRHFKVCKNSDCTEFHKEKFFSIIDYTKGFDISAVKKDMSDAQKRKLIYTEQNAFAGMVFTVVTEKVTSYSETRDALLIRINTFNQENKLSKMKKSSNYKALFKDQRNTGWKNPRPYSKRKQLQITVYEENYKKLITVKFPIFVACAYDFETSFGPQYFFSEPNRYLVELLKKKYYIDGANLSLIDHRDHYIFHSPFVYEGNRFIIKDTKEKVYSFGISKGTHITKVDYKFVD
ncbi:MAG: hypothetical protein MJ250_07920 [Alphaproteobacteria bacterium]|nr:hypothetical protein [Alphaproteobacteria bacterium]